MARHGGIFGWDGRCPFITRNVDVRMTEPAIENVYQDVVRPDRATLDLHLGQMTGGAAGAVGAGRKWSLAEFLVFLRCGRAVSHTGQQWSGG